VADWFHVWFRDRDAPRAHEGGFPSFDAARAALGDERGSIWTASFEAWTSTGTCVFESERPETARRVSGR
jgi:hypothetical protein